MRRTCRKIRYAVVGLGNIAQTAVLPAFQHARENCQLTALVSDDPEKRRELGKRYGVKQTYVYEDYEKCLRSGEVDAVYIALPNHLHCDFSVRAAEAGIHVLCEKPMAVTVEECRRMMTAAEGRNVKLMIAYRLHFDKANLRAVQLSKAGKLGNPRFFNSSFAMQVREGDVRVQANKGGGVLFDIGIYCINAVRYLFRAEPLEVTAYSASWDDPRFEEVAEMTGGLLRFPGERLAAFTTSFGARAVDWYELVGTEGWLRLENGYAHDEKRTLRYCVGGRLRQQHFPVVDQFAAELVYFSRCVLKNQTPEPSGHEGLADVRIIEALQEAAANGRRVKLGDFPNKRRPRPGGAITRPPIKEPELVHATSSGRHLQERRIHL